MHTEYRKSSEKNVYGMYVMESRIFEPYHEAHRMCAGITYFEPYREAHRICTWWNHAFFNLFKWPIVRVLDHAFWNHIMRPIVCVLQLSIEAWNISIFGPYREAHRMSNCGFF